MRYLAAALVALASCATTSPATLEDATCTRARSATLRVQVREPSGRIPYAEVRAEPCCQASCRASPVDAEGRAMLAACPAPGTNEVIVSVDTNPRWYLYTPPRSVRVCAPITELTIDLSPHPPPP
jgi:hypothetical protein